MSLAYLFRYLAQTVGCSIPAMSVVSSGSMEKQPAFESKLSLIMSTQISIIWFCASGLKYEAILGQLSKWFFRYVSPQSARMRRSALKIPVFSAGATLKSIGPLSLWPRRARPCHPQKEFPHQQPIHFLLFSHILLCLPWSS